MPIKRNRIPQIRRNVARAAGDGLDAIAQEGKQVRDARVPVDKGDLKASGEILRPSATRRVLQEGRGLPDARAVFTEYGTSTQRPQPHMSPAYYHMQRVARALMARAVKEAIR